MNFTGLCELPEKASNEESFKTLYDYWCAISPGNGLLPGRQHLNPAEIIEILGRIALVDVSFDNGKYDFHYRLWGSFLTEIIGKDCTGKFISELFPPENLPLVQNAFESVVETACPHYWEVAWGVEERDHVGYKRLLLPLAEDGTKVNMILGMVIETDKDITGPTVRLYRKP
ncbi:PAS domain-containing protein [Kiloniella antarctica]|uniref:PAS domain-containing protein n=1 Tax=Kiloniella antarctica TaxID=1550907 RepID=A0ABW5BQG3_9PROT